MVVLLRRRMYHVTVTQSDSVGSSPPTVGVVGPSASIHVHVRQTVLHPGLSSLSSADKSATGDGQAWREHGVHVRRYACEERVRLRVP